MKLFLQVCMCLSADFFLWISGETRWNSSSSSVIICLSVLEHSLSKMCIFGFRPLSLSVLCITLYTLVRSVPYFDFMGSTMMAFESCSYYTIMYLYPLADVTGNRPVWYVYILDENSITDKNTWCNRVWGIYISDKIFFGISIRCSFFSLLGIKSLLDSGSLLGVLFCFSLGSSDGIVVDFLKFLCFFYYWISDACAPSLYALT